MGRNTQNSLLQQTSLDNIAWNMSVINAPDAWGKAYNTTAIPDVNVGIIDGSFTSYHDDIKFAKIFSPSPAEEYEYT